MAICRDLIFDLGVNDGRDALYYLDKGFRVVGVEANPRLYGNCTARLRQDTRMTLLNVGVWNEPRQLPFYVNLSNDHWSSFDPNYGCRDGTPFEVEYITCVTIADLLREHGTPHYLKIDIEGADKLVLQDLRKLNDRPQFISVEEYGVAALDDLHTLGYEHFQIVPQSNPEKRKMRPPKPAREGRYIKRAFTDQDSGLFGYELSLDKWVNYADARSLFLATVTDEGGKYVGPPHEWFDIHARL